MSHDNVILKL